MFTRETAGVTRANLSVEPLATEEESTPGPADWNPFDDPSVDENAMRELDLNGYSDAEEVGFALPGMDKKREPRVDLGREPEPFVPDLLGWE